MESYFTDTAELFAADFSAESSESPSAQERIGTADWPSYFEQFDESAAEEAPEAETFEEQSEQPDTGSRPLLVRGARGADVLRAQQLLNRFLADIGEGPGGCVDQSDAKLRELLVHVTALRRGGQLPLKLDGLFGPYTERATTLFQACLGLVRDGKIGPVTWHYLERYGGGQKINPPDTAGCGVPDVPAAELEGVLNLERQMLEEAPRRRGVVVSARLSLFQNASIASHRNHFQAQASRVARTFATIAEPRADRCLPRRVGPTQYDTGADIVTLISAAHTCLGKRLTAVHVFGHSGPTGAYGSTTGSDGLYVSADAQDRATGARSIADVPVAALAEDVVVVLHGCNQAYGSGSFAETLYRHLAATLKAPVVFAHPNSGCAGRDNSWRRFDARTPTGRAVASIAPHYSGDGGCTKPKPSRETEEHEVAPTHGCGCGGRCGGRVAETASTVPSLAESAVSGEAVGGFAYSEAFDAFGFVEAPPSAEVNGFEVFAGEAARCPDVPVSPADRPALLGRNSVHPAVRDVQRRLNIIHAQRTVAGLSGIDAAPLVEDCVFGPNTESAVRSFQRIAFPGQSSEHDGKVGRKTWAQLDLAATPRLLPPPPDPQPGPAPAAPPPPSPRMAQLPNGRPCCLLYPDQIRGADTRGDSTVLEPGIVYTAKAGFVDLGHVWDLCFLTAWIYQNIHEAGGNVGTSFTTGELDAWLTSSAPSTEWMDLARAIAFDQGLAHEISSYYQFSTPGGHNSSFSPEDLCSNFLGTVVAERALRAGGDFRQAAHRELAALLTDLGAQSEAETKKAFELAKSKGWIDMMQLREFLGRLIPLEKYLRRRNFTRVPWQVGHPSDGAIPAYVTTPVFVTLRWDFTHKSMRFNRAAGPGEILKIRADASRPDKYGPAYDKP